MISITVVMILRVYAMWNRSKKILYGLLFIYAPQVMVSFAFSVFNFTSSTNFSVTVDQVIGPSVCNSSGITIGVQSLPATYAQIPRLVLDATLLVLAVIQTLKQAADSYKVTKKWQPNRYMQQLVKDGVLYVLMYVALSPSHSFPFGTSTISRLSYARTSYKN
ncbi:hypothetical protein J3R83DRAFT_14052 [Lanmaoa asiatica]|nr:hypothetical protein J3R83DRAFT_14052 [Lanmaoa asiatica]